MYHPLRKLGNGALGPDDFIRNEKVLYDNIIQAFDENVNATMEWLQTPAAAEFFIAQEGRLSTFMTESGIRDEWNNIIRRRASRGADLTTQIYDYARRVNMENYLQPYTPAETLAMNRLCDYNYELIVNVTQDQISGIRRQLVQDYAEGINPRQTSMREILEQIQLEPINGWTPEQRAVVIARTESARALDISTLETYRADGITHVSLYGSDQCDECQEYNTPIPIEQALEIGVVHPNCRCSWLPESEVQI